MIITTSLGDLVPQSIIGSLREEVVEAILGDIAEAARNHWIGLAGQYLNSSRNDYINGIQPVEFTPGLASISLVGQPANLIENGMSEVDLRDWLLGPSVPEAPPGQKGKRRAKDGSFYRSIPIRHGTPGTAGSVGAPMGDPYRGVVAGARELGREVYAKAKQLKPGQQLPAGLMPKLKAHHSTDIYAGMIRQRKTYKSATQSSYMTFRTISTGNTTGWIRPATGPRGFAERTATFVGRIAPQAFQAYVDGLG